MKAPQGGVPGRRGDAMAGPARNLLQGTSKRLPAVPVGKDAESDRRLLRRASRLRTRRRAPTHQHAPQ
jgi:hypothetical protein